MKIALIGNDYIQQFPLKNYGGIETCVENLAKGLHDIKKDFFVICPKRLRSDSYPFEIYETQEEPTSISNKHSSFFAYSAAKILEKLKFDVIWCQSNWSIEPLAKFKKPMICTFHDSCEKQYGWMKKLDFVKYRFISNFQYNNWVKEDWEKNKSFVCYTGLEKNEFNLNRNKSDYFLWCAGLRWGLESKGLDIFIELAKLNKKYNFLAYGTGNPELEKYLNNLKISNFEFKGGLARGDEHIKMFKNAKGLIMPTRIKEALGRTVIESFSKGTPVFGSKNGALNELIEDKKTGIKFDLDNLNIDLDQKFDYEFIYKESKKFSIENEIESLMKESLFK